MLLLTWTSTCAVVTPYCLQVTKIERVQNGAMWDNYLAQRKLKLKKYARGIASGDVRLNSSSAGGGLCIERRLWHGTGRGNVTPYQLVQLESGWCASYAAQGSCGKGTYFAPDPEYSKNGYASMHKGHNQLILADVLIGAQPCNFNNVLHVIFGFRTCSGSNVEAYTGKCAMQVPLRQLHKA